MIFNNLLRAIPSNFNAMMSIKMSGSAPNSDYAVFTVGLIIGLVSIVILLGIIIYTNLIGKDDEETDTDESAEYQKSEQEVVNQIACPKCGNTDLAFVNVIHSKKKVGFFLIATIVIAVIVLIVFCTIIAINLHEIAEAESFESQIINGISLYAVTGIVVDIVSVILLISAYIKLIPYYNKNEIRYVCKRCGHHNDIDTINGKK